MGLREDIRREPVSALGLRKVIPMSSSASVREAVAAMRENRRGYVTVQDEAGRPRGMFTERGLIRLLTTDASALDGPVGPHVSTEVPCVKATDSIATLLEVMQRERVRFVCVLDDEGKALGVTGQRGVMEYIADHFPRTVKAQVMDSKLSMDQREGA